MNFELSKDYREFCNELEKVGEVPCQNYPDLFFPETGGNGSAAKALCQSCPVKLQCLDYALKAGEDHGVWGGLNAHERGKIRNARRTVR